MPAQRTDLQQTTATTSPELITRARGLTAMLASHAAEAERIRKPVDAVIRALEEAEIFKLMVPRCYGGLELDLDTFLEVGLALGEGDTSMAWVANFYIEHNWILSQFPAAFQQELFANRSYVLAPAMLAPAGVATREGAGYRLNGRWQWASGVMHCDWVIPGAREQTPDGKPDPRWFAVPLSEVKVEDTWYVDGMVGTGSNDVVIENVYIPAERSVSMVEMGNDEAPGSRLHAGPLYRTPMLPVLTIAALTPALGQARVAVQRFREGLTDRMRLGSRVKQGHKASAQMRLARVEVEVREAELLVRDVVTDVCARRNTAPMLDRARWATQFATAVDRCKRVVQTVVEASGAHAHFLDHPLQRALRDLNTISCHVVFDLDGRLEAFGRLMLGLDAGGALL